MTMDAVTIGDGSVAAPGGATLPEPAPSAASPSTSNLSDAPARITDGAETTSGASPPLSSVPTPQIVAPTDSALERVNANTANATDAGKPGWEAAQEQTVMNVATPDKVSTTAPSRNISTPRRGGLSGKRVGVTANRGTSGGDLMTEPEGEASHTPGSNGRGRGKGRGGRPRGRGRGGGRGGKRKREDGDSDDSDSSEVYTPAVTTTKSGRSVQKPTSFVPPPQSPTTNKRKRPYRRNPESAVCKICLRGTSPTGNMIVFCDGCNTPYHRYCHHPPISQKVVDDVDMEWYCEDCEKERVVPVPESEIAHLVDAGGASEEQRQRYFARLPPGVLVTLLTKATRLRPDLPLFAPDFHSRFATQAGAEVGQSPDTETNTPTKAHVNRAVAATTPSLSSTHASASSIGTSAVDITSNSTANIEEEKYGPEEHPAHYPRPGQGLMKTLPPEKDDAQWLTEDDSRFGVFSHMYRADPTEVNGRASDDVK